MTNSCRGCTNAVNDAWDKVTDFLLYPPVFIARQDLEWLKGLVRLAWRVEQNPDHDDAGWVIQQLLDGWASGGAPEYYRQISEFEEDHPVVYPRHLRTIQEIIERRCRIIEPDT